MKSMPSRTVLVLALAAAWPLLPAFGAEGNALDDAPLRLTMSLQMELPRSPHPMPVPQAPQDGADVSALVRDPRRAATAGLKLERVLALHRRSDGVQPAPVVAAAGRLDPELLARALQAIERAPEVSWGKGPADTIVDGEFRRALMHYVRLQMPALPIWQAPRPDAPVQPIAPPPSTAPAVAPPIPDERGVRAAPARQPDFRPGSSGKRPLRGRVWRLSDEGFKAYARGDYATALLRAEAALELRPDAVRLHQLRVYALQKLSRLDDALHAAEQAIAQGHTSPELEQAVANLRPAGPAAAGEVPTTPEYRKAFPIATLAYQQQAAGKHEAAAANAEIAVRTDPSQGDWALLWLNALEDLQRYEEAIAAGAQAISLGAPNPEAIGALMRLASQAIAVQHAQKAYEAMGGSRPQDAVPEAREAVRRAPDVVSHRLLLISALQATQDIAGAEAAASDALQADDESATLHLQRAYLRAQLGQANEAQQDIDAVLAQDWIDEALRRNSRLIGADLALAGGQRARALELLAPLSEGDSQAAARRAQAGGAGSWWRQGDALPVSAYAPLQLCHETPYGTVCEMEPWDSPGTDNPAARAYAAYGQKRYEQAIALARMAVAQDPKSSGNQTLLTTALAAGTRAEQEEAMARLDQALAAQPADANALRQRGYLRLAHGEPALALADFVAARETGQAPATNVLDEAYAMAAAGRRPAAAVLLRQAIDDADAGRMPLDAQQRFDTRSAIASFSREWGVTASVGYRGARAPSNGLVGQPVSLPGNAAFSTVEAYWRPSGFLNSSSSTFDVYGRISNTLYSGSDLTGAQSVPDPCGGTIEVGETRSRPTSGFPTTTGAIGVRYTPWAENNLTFGLERQFLIGNAARGGFLNPSDAAVRCALNQQAAAVAYQTEGGAGAWQAYALYGFYEGTGLRIDTSSWFTMEGYLQLGYTRLDAPTAYTLRDSNGQVLGRSEGKLRRGQGFAAGEVRVGRSFVTDYNERLVFFPHVSLAADWYSNRARAAGTPVAGHGDFDLADSGRDWSLGAGVGVNVRYWLAGDRYRAQSSYVDASLQYRARVGGVTDRARGLFLSVTFAY